MSIRKVLLVLLPFGIIINLSVINNISYLYFREIFSCIYLLICPGLFLSWVIGLRLRNVWEFLCYTTGLSLTILMVLGLSISLISPYFHITKPLSSIPALLSIDLLLIIFWIFLFIKNKSFKLENVEFTLPVKSILFSLIPLLFPAISIIGAINLNNDMTNIFTMIMLGVIAFFVLLLTLVRNHINKHVFPFTIFMIALSLLLMNSLRGWYITGHDIFLEYFVFQITKAHDIWKMTNFQDPYNACLSITILPTIISNITRINDLYIYKALYQIIFSFSIIGTYIFIKKFVNSFLAFLGTFAIVSLPTFMTDMPMLNRQEIALFFFVLLLNTLFNNNFSIKIKWLLFLLFGFGLLFSHYSTTYLTVGLFIATTIGYLLLRLITIHKHIKKISNKVDNKLGITDNKQNTHIGMAVILLVATIIWNVNITNTASGIISTFNKTGTAISSKKVDTAKSDPAAYGLLNNKAPSKRQLLDEYIKTQSSFVRKFNDESAFIAKDIVRNYRIDTGSQVKLPLTPIGKLLTKYHINVFSLNDQLKQLYAKVMQIFIVIGFFSMFLYKKHLKIIEKEYLAMTIIFFFILVVQVILPSGSINYGILRLFQQGLILFAIPLLMGAFFVFGIFNKIHPSIKIYLTSFCLVFFFLYLSGFIPTLTGGYYPQLNLSNAGFYYDAYYTHTHDIVAMDWLSKNRDKKTPVQSDWFALKKIHTYEGFYSIDGLIPSVIRRNSYVYLSVSNLKTNNVIIYANGAPLYYKLPLDFFNQNKNLIYSNGESRIYR